MLLFFLVFSFWSFASILHHRLQLHKHTEDERVEEDEKRRREKETDGVRHGVEEGYRKREGDIFVIFQSFGISAFSSFLYNPM